MQVLATIRVKGVRCPLLRELAERQRIGLRILTCKPLPTKDGLVFITMKAGKNPEEKIRDDEIKYLKTWEAGSGRYVGAAILSCSYKKLGLKQSQIRAIRILGKNAMYLDLMFLDEAELRETVKILRERGVKPQLTKLRKLEKVMAITPRQEEALAAAIAMGYYEYPRKLNLTKLAEKLSIAPTTLSEILRRAERKLITSYLVNNL